MSRIAYVNGAYVPQREASVNVEDRGYQFADGVYEVVYVLGGRLVDEDLHLARLERSLREIRISMPMTRPALVNVLHEVSRQNRITEGLIYMQVTRGVARRDHAFPKAPVKPALVVTARRTPPYPRDIDAWATTAITQPDQRWARCDIKSVGLLANVLAKQAAREQGAAEALLIDADGLVTEGASTSAWIVGRDSVLRTRPLSHAILPGCTRAALVTLLAEEGIAFEERAFTADELRDASEVFITSATSFVRPITALDGVAVGSGAPGPVTRKLFALFARHAQGSLANAA
ncbi:MAG: D-amino-acid transaminase [Acetobacteraceae bacterium]|nr:D-amino-acid transaminase [Acetobacteraceae bacterium]